MPPLLSFSCRPLRWATAPALRGSGCSSSIHRHPSCLRFTSTLTPTSIAALLSPSPPSAPSSSPSPAETLAINGFVRTVRKQKRIAFAAIGDGSSMQTIQAVLTPEQADGLSTGVAVAATGKWTPSPGHEQSHELQIESIRILGCNDATTYPLQKKYHSPEFLRTLPHLRSRLPFNSLLLRLRSLVTAQVTNYFATHDFVQCHTPIITSSDCEGAGEVFTIAPDSSDVSSLSSPNQATEPEDPFFGSPKYLTVSSQLHLEALAQSVNKVWALSPTFRAEKSDTARHLSEFYMLEAELAFVDDVRHVMSVVEDMLRDLATRLKSSHVGNELLEARKREQREEGVSISHTELEKRWQALIDGPWPQITYEEAVQHLQNAVAHGTAKFDHSPSHEDGLQTEHERFLAESVGNGGPVFVTDYPRNIKPFYMAPSFSSKTGDQSTSTVACFDLLVPEICELVGGSMREHRLPELLQNMDEKGFQHASDPDGQASDSSLQWYLDLRRYGSVPHGGFGLGFDRLLCYLSGVSNIRDIVSFPRWHKRCDC